MPLSKTIHTEWDAGEAMRLRQILIEHKRDLMFQFLQDPLATSTSLVYNVHISGINNVKKLIKRVEDPLVEQGYVDFAEPEYLVMVPTGDSWSLRDPGGVIGDNPVGSGKR